jgi:glycerol uptake facilitator-like aquaporin
MKKYIAEFLGTSTLTFVVGLSIAGVFPVPTPVLAALTLGLFVYSIGHISGTQINPAVTISALSIGKISFTEAGAYIAAQLLGAAAALFALQYVVAMPTLPLDTGVQIGLAEALGTFLFTFGIASVIYGRAPSQVSGLVVAGSLLLGITVAVLMGANGVLNPAVALGIGSFNLMYVLGPIVGGVAGMRLYQYLN